MPRVAAIAAALLLAGTMAFAKHTTECELACSKQALSPLCGALVDPHGQVLVLEAFANPCTLLCAQDNELKNFEEGHTEGRFRWVEWENAIELAPQCQEEFAADGWLSSTECLECPAWAQLEQEQEQV